MIHHPKTRGERRRINKKYVNQEEHDEAIARRLAQEALEAREAIDELRHVEQETSD